MFGWISWYIVFKNCSVLPKIIEIKLLTKLISEKRWCCKSVSDYIIWIICCILVHMSTLSLILGFYFQYFVFLWTFISFVMWNIDLSLSLRDILIYILKSYGTISPKSIHLACPFQPIDKNSSKFSTKMIISSSKWECYYTLLFDSAWIRVG